jgi:hypothetical protein
MENPTSGFEDIRMSMRFVTSLPSAVLITFLLTPSYAFADEETNASNIGAARELAIEGTKLADADKCDQAVDPLAKAEVLFHAPTTLGRLGECRVKLGKLVQGTEDLQRVVRESLPPTATPAFFAAQERAKKVLDEARAKLAKLRVRIVGPADAQVVAKIDGQSVPSASLNANRPMDPGEHIVELSAPGYKVTSTKVLLKEGASESIALALEADPNAVATVATPAAPVANGSSPENTPIRTITEDKAGTSNLVPAYVAWGIAGGGLLVGTIAGSIALGKQSDLDATCVNKACPDSSKSIHDSMTSAGTISTVGFAVAGVGAVAGVILYFVGTREKEATVSGVRFLPSFNGISGRF